LIALMVYSFARIGAALHARRGRVHAEPPPVGPPSKGGKRHEMPCHHNLEDYLTAYIDGCALREDRKGPLFRTIARGTKRLSDTPCPKPMPLRWCADALARPRSGRRSATTLSAQPALPPI
jgi:hypothetical protein